MFAGIRLYPRAEDEAEKPFWISYADLMTSLMVLFLVVLLASLVSLTRTVTDLQTTKSQAEVLAQKYKELKKAEGVRDRRVAHRRSRIAEFWDELERSSRGLGIRVNRDSRIIDFGERARFASGSDVLSDADQLLLRTFVPRLLTVTQSPLGRQVVSKIVVAGYADKRGSYLFNLNLSSNRSQRVLCSLLKPGGAQALTPGQKNDVRDLFLVGGFSFNDSRRSLAASRRVEVRVDFLPLNKHRTAPQRANTAFGDCPLGGRR